jgi:hypothetical protein
MRICSYFINFGPTNKIKINSIRVDNGKLVPSDTPLFMCERFSRFATWPHVSRARSLFLPCYDSLRASLDASHKASLKLFGGALDNFSFPAACPKASFHPVQTNTVSGVSSPYIPGPQRTLHARRTQQEARRAVAGPTRQRHMNGRSTVAYLATVGSCRRNGAQTPSNRISLRYLRRHSFALNKTPTYVLSDLQPAGAIHLSSLTTSNLSLPSDTDNKGKPPEWRHW